MKKVWFTLIPILSAVLALSVLFFCLEYYAPHGEIELLSRITAFVCAGADAVVMDHAIRNKNQTSIILCIISLMLCIGVYVVACRIPFCPMCDGISAEELGFLSHWIKTDM